MTSKCKRYCSVPQCKNYKSETVSIHYFPNDPNLTKKWATALRIEKPISKGMSVCSDHFLPSDFHPLRQYSTKRYLKIGVIPSQKIPVKKFDQPKSSTSHARISSASRAKTSEKRETQPTQNNEEKMDVIEHKQLEEGTAISSLDIIKMDHLYTQHTVTDLNHENMEFSTLDKSVQVNNVHGFDYKLRYDEFLLSSDFKLRVYTGVDIKLFNSIKELVLNALKLFPTLSAINIERKICVILTKLKLDISFQALGIMYELSDITIQKYFHDYVIVLYYALKSAICISNKEKNLKNLPIYFKNYNKVRIIINAIEVPVQEIPCLNCRIRSYSYNKKTYTSKFLISICPTGLIAHISAAYGGHVSEKTIFNSEKIIDLLDPNHDVIMVDKDVLIERECAEKGIDLIRPTFVRQNKQLSKEEPLNTASICVVERIIQRIKIFKIFSNKLDWALVPYLSEMMTIVCAIVNLSQPVLSDDKIICHNVNYTI